MPAGDAREALSALAAGDLEFLLLAPEQLGKDEVQAALKEAEPSLFVVDEAHCVSEWGHDFRPDYLNLKTAIEFLGHPTVLAMTATAGPDVRSEIMERLGMRDPKFFVHGFDRPNISLRVDHLQSEEAKLDALTQRVRSAEKPGIVYTGTRTNAESIMGSLGESGINAVFYHGGMKARYCEAVQERFMKGAAEVIVATNAFGMGVDKLDVRFVYHFDICDSLDSYYQEIGRAGRDGEPAEAVLFYRAENIGLRRFQAGSGRLPAKDIEKVASMFEKLAAPETIDAIARETGMSKRKALNVVNRLEEVGALRPDADGSPRYTFRFDCTEAPRLAAAAQERFRQAQRRRIEVMRQYAELSTCRREFLLRYFADAYQGPCRNCDNDNESLGAPVSDAAGTRREVSIEA